MSKIVDAVSVVITCGNEVFAIQRQPFLGAFPGYWAFPGGKVEANDADHCPPWPLLEGIDLRLFGAALREAHEELGVDLRDELARGRVAGVHYLGLAVTPDFNPYRFATSFFKVELTEKPEFVVDRNEVRIGEWVSAGELLRRYDRGQLLAVPPVIKVIQTLGRDPAVRAVPDINFTYDGARFVPWIESLKGIRQVMPLSHTLPPATRTNAFVIGDDVRVVVDPSPRDDAEYEKFRNTLALFGADKIFLTHHHPDHYERANRLARELCVPVLLSAYTRRRILEKDPGFFDGVAVAEVREGDAVTTWLGRTVRVLEVPGHDEGQLALYPEDNSWFLAGDLFQGVGTVVIGGAEGDMKKYFATLERVIALGPAVVFPSHGIGLGGTSILEKTLAHRRLRETQVLALHQEGFAPEEMLPKLYADVRPELWPYALENIRKHLAKLAAEGLLGT
jgi:ribonuclease/clavin/mitogillin